MADAPDMVFERVAGRFVPVLPRRDRQPDDRQFFTIAGVARLTGRSPDRVRREWTAWYGDGRPDRYFKLVGVQPVPCESFDPDALDLAAVAGRVGWSEAALVALSDVWFGTGDGDEPDPAANPPTSPGATVATPIPDLDVAVAGGLFREKIAAYAAEPLAAAAGLRVLLLAMCEAWGNTDAEDQQHFLNTHADRPEPAVQPPAPATDPRPPGRRGHKADTFAHDSPLAPWAAKLRRAGLGRYGCRYAAVLVALDAAKELLCDARDRFSPDRPHDEAEEHKAALDHIYEAEAAVRAAATWITLNEARHVVTGKVRDFWPPRGRFNQQPDAGSREEAARG